VTEEAQSELKGLDKRRAEAKAKASKILEMGQANTATEQRVMQGAAACDAGTACRGDGWTGRRTWIAASQYRKQNSAAERLAKKSSTGDKSAPGLIEPANVDLANQPRVKNPDGTTSTVDSRSFNVDGTEVLLPSVTPDGRHLQTDDEILAEYQKTGRHLGKFDTPEHATAYASQLHNDYAKAGNAFIRGEDYQREDTRTLASAACTARMH